jgi:predicted DNA-binding protein with PD1-like motif
VDDLNSVHASHRKEARDRGARRVEARKTLLEPLVHRALVSQSRAMRLRSLACLLGVLVTSCAAPRAETRSFVVRLKPGQELKTEITKLARAEDLQAASIVSAVGSLTDVALRFANRNETTRLTGHFEVVSLSGYLAANEFHVHMAVSDGEGRTIGGHVMDGNVVYTTLVVVVEEHERWKYRREYDPASKYDELVIDPR